MPSESRSLFAAALSISALLLGSCGRPQAEAQGDLLHTKLARHYWDPTGNFERQMPQVLALLHGKKPVYAWDVWMIYPADAVWGSTRPPRPAFLMHQLPGLDNAKFPPLDSRSSPPK